MRGGGTWSPIGTLCVIVGCLAGLSLGLHRSEPTESRVSFLEATREDGRGEWGGCTIAPVPDAERGLVRRAIERAVAVYPKGLFETNVRGGVALASEIVLRGVAVGGLTYEETETVLVGASPDPRYAAYEAEKSFHHEFSHLLLSGHRSIFPEAAWRAANPRGFHYLDRYGLDTIRQGIHLLPPEPARLAGFADPYGASNLDEDVAMVAEMLMSDDRTVLDGLATYPRLERKCRLLIQFYQAIDPAFRPPADWDRDAAPKTRSV